MKSLNLIFVLIILSVSVQGQNLKKAFKYLNNNDFDRSKVIFDEAANNPEMSAIAHYGISLIFANESYRSRDLYRAFEEINKSLHDFSQVNPTLLTKLSDYSVSKEEMEKHKTNIDNQLRRIVIDADNIKETEKFLEKAKLSAHLKEIKNLYSKQSFLQALEYNTINVYEDFIKSFPESKEVASAQQKIYSLAYEDVIKLDKLEAYQSFIKKYPMAPQVEGAKAKVVQKEYEMVLMTGTDDAFDRFIKKYPNTKQSQDLRDKQLQLNYIQAKQLNSIAVYNKFLSKFPASAFSKEITLIRDSLAFMEAKKTNTKEAYKDFINNYPNAKQVPQVMAIQKDLSYSKPELAALKSREVFASRNISKVEYLKININDTTKRAISKVVFYDKFGNAIKSTETTIAGAKVEINRTFSENGRNLLQETKTVDKKSRYEITYYYNEKDLKDSARKICYLPCEDGLSAGKYLFLYVYDNNRNIKKITIKGSDGKYIKTSTFAINNQHLVAQELVKIIENEKETNLKINYQYDFYDHLIQKSSFTGENKISAVETYFYNKQGKVTKYSSYDAFGKIRKSNHYDASGLLVSTEVTYPNDVLSDHNIIYKYYYRHE